MIQFLFQIWAIVLLLLGGLFANAQESISLRKMTSLPSPLPDKIYSVTDPDKAGNWQYDPNDKTSVPNEGTVLASTRRDVKGRFRRVYDSEDGVNIDWFLTRSLASGSINYALEAAMAVSEKINFANKTYQIEPIVITSQRLANPKSLRLNFQNTTLRAVGGQKKVQILQIEDIVNLSLSGTLTLDGNAARQKIEQPLAQGGAAFLQIIAPAKSPQSKLEMGSITIRNMPMCGLNIDTRDNFYGTGYDRIVARAFREINGFNHLNIQKDDFAVWGFNVRGAHCAVLIDSLYAQQDNEPWGDAPVEKPFYTFTFENQVDPTVHRRKDSLYVKSLWAKYPCSLIFYTQAVNHVLVDNYLMENVLRKQNVDDARAYPTLLRKNISWVGSKHTWTSYRSPSSSFRIKKLVIKNTNPAFMNEMSLNDMTGLWLNKAISGAVFDEVETDVRLKMHGDGYYFGFDNVSDGNHRIKRFVCHIPAKRNYVQPLNADLTIDQLHLAAGTGVTFAMGNAKIGAISQEENTQATFESRENKFKNGANRYNGFIVNACQATNITWKFNWFISDKNLLNEATISAGERYEFRNFSGNNLLQTHATVSNASNVQTYVSAFKYDADAPIRSSIQKYLQLVEFDWANVTMKLADPSASNFARRLLPLRPNSSEGLLNTTRRSRGVSAGWKTDWKPNRFVQCTILP